jgi:tetratricopeptide (TPR) repeat protein
MAILLAIMLNPTHDRQSQELNRVFFTASHAIVAMFIGYAVALIAATMLTHYDQFRLWGLIGSGVAICFALYALAARTQEFYGERPGVNGLKVLFDGLVNAFHKDQYALPVYANMLLLAMVLAFLGNLVFSRLKPHMPVVLTVFALMPTYAILCNWFDNEQRGHWFGYWFGHDMFTPPFVGPDKQFGCYDAKLREQAAKGADASLVYPEMTRDAILFGGTDPGRFAPTYMIFCDSFIPDKCKPEFDQNFNRRDVYIITQNALADGTYLEYIRSHYFRSDQLKYDSPFFLDLLRLKGEKTQNYSTNFIAALAFETLDKPLTALGAKIEARRRREGVYPPKEIYEPTPRDSEICFGEYTADAERRMQHDMQFPNEPKQIRLGENVTPVNDGNQMRIQVSGQVAVMAINALLTKVIFDHNPTNEFFVEESFPLDWMYPHLTPFGVIMKINRQPLPELSDEICRRDHDFWSRYSERFIGNWITYDTKVKDIADFAEKVYLRHDFSGFKGDRKFVRDDQGQKAFSKLRSSIAGIYAWRLGMSGSPTPTEYNSMLKSEAERQRMIREADFAFKQSFAFCPYSPEAVFRYINLLANPNIRRYDDALIVAETCQKLDPYNPQISGLVDQLKAMKNQPNEVAALQNQAALLESELHSNPNDFQKAFDLAQIYMRFQQVDRVIGVLDSVLNNTNAPPAAVLGVVQAYAQMNNLPKLEPALERLVKVAPNGAENWYNLAVLKATLGKNAEALQALRQSFDLNAKRLPPGTNIDLRAEAEKDPHFNALRATPEYKALIAH